MMKLNLKLIDLKNGIRSEEMMELLNDDLLIITPQKLWFHYTTLLDRIENNRKEFIKNKTLKSNEKE